MGLLDMYQTETDTQDMNIGTETAKLGLGQTSSGLQTEAGPRTQPNSLSKPETEPHNSKLTLKLD